MCVECIVSGVTCKCGTPPDTRRCECEAGLECTRCGHRPITPAPPPPAPTPTPVPPKQEGEAGPTEAATDPIGEA